jgi:hypothetical protein
MGGGGGSCIVTLRSSGRVGGVEAECAESKKA